MVEALTNEAFKDFSNNFELTQYAINLAQYYIRSGRETSLSEIIRDVKKHPPQYLEELKEKDAMKLKEEMQDHLQEGNG